MRKIAALIGILGFSVFGHYSAFADGTVTNDSGTTIAVVPTDFCNDGAGYVDLDTPEWNYGQVILHARVMLPGSIVEDYENVIGSGATANYGFRYVGESLEEAVLVMFTAEYVTSDGNVFTSPRVDVQMDDACLTVVTEVPVVFEPTQAPPTSLVITLPITE